MSVVGSASTGREAKISVVDRETQRDVGNRPGGGRGAEYGSGSGESASALPASLERYTPADESEARDLGRVVVLLESVADPWARSEPLHLTASAIVVHVPSRRVLLRWHERHHRYMQVGGHGDAGENDPLAVALREAAEETGLSDLRPVRNGGEKRRHAADEAGPPESGRGGVAGVASGGGSVYQEDLVQVVVVPVPARGDEAAHEHADLRFVLQTDRPDEARPEKESARLKWVTWEEAFELVGEANLHVLLERARRIVDRVAP